MKFHVQAFAVVFENGNFSLRATLPAAELLYSAEAHMAAREGSKTSRPIAIVELAATEVIAIDEEVHKAMQEKEEEDDNEAEGEFVDDNDQPLCGYCAGSGEGRRPGYRCHNCRGSGLEPIEGDD